MNGQRVVAVVLLVASLFVLGTLSASLGSTVTATPNDAIDVDENSMPFVGDGSSDIASSYEQASDGEALGASARNADSSASSAASSGEGSPPQSATGGSAGDGSAGTSGQRDQGQSGSQGGQDSGDQQGGQAGADSRSGQGSSVQRGAGQGNAGDPTESLWSLLQRLLGYFLKVLALVALLAGAVALSRRRERLLARLHELAMRLGIVTPTDRTIGGPVATDQAEASTVVERAWGELIAASPVEPATSDTPRECARAMIEAGVDDESVSELTDMYEKVRYGERPVTPEEASRALGYVRDIAPGDRQPSVEGAAVADGPDVTERGRTEGLGAATADAGEGRT